MYEEADRLDPADDAECRAGNTPLIVFFFFLAARERADTRFRVSFAKATTAAPRKWSRLRLENRRDRHTAREPRLTLTCCIQGLTTQQLCSQKTARAR